MVRVPLDLKCPKNCIFLVLFFTNAMEVCQLHVMDVQLAYQVNDLLNYGENYKFLGDSMRESIY